VRGTGRDGRAYEVCLRRHSLKSSNRERERVELAADTATASDSIKERGKELYEAAAALHRVAVWHVHRVQQLEREVDMWKAGRAESPLRGGGEGGGGGIGKDWAGVPICNGVCNGEEGLVSRSGEGGNREDRRTSPSPHSLGAPHQAAVLAKNLGPDGLGEGASAEGPVGVAAPTCGQVTAALTASPLPYLTEALVNVQRAVEGIYPSSSLPSGRTLNRPSGSAGGESGWGAGGAGGHLQGQRSAGIGVALAVEARKVHGNLVKFFKVTETLRSAAGASE